MCADDYGLDEISSMHIQECIDRGALHRVSVFPNLEKVDLARICKYRKVQLSLHLNLVEGTCMAHAGELDLLADENGYLKYSFIGLLKNSLLHRKRFENQVYKEIRAQVLFWKGILPEGMPFCIDSHQHTHMIPAVFHMLLRVLRDEGIVVHHMRIPVEPLLPFIKSPSLYHTYKPVNIVKQWLLKFLWMINQIHFNQDEIPSSCFFGILFSGMMDQKRVSKLLPNYIKIAQKSQKDVEVLFHPGYHDSDQSRWTTENVAFEHFYLSENRKTEFDSVISFIEGNEM
jgi:hypothetical protein